MADDTSSRCACDAAPTLIFPCSGASDVGEIADRSARQLTQQGTGRMYCLAGVGGRVSGIIATTRAAERVLTIDGCPLACARHCLEEAGFTQFTHLQLADIGLKKGESPAAEDHIERVVAAACERLAN